MILISGAKANQPRKAKWNENLRSTRKVSGRIENMCVSTLKCRLLLAGRRLTRRLTRLVRQLTSTTPKYACWSRPFNQTHHEK